MRDKITAFVSDWIWICLGAVVILVGGSMWMAKCSSDAAWIEGQKAVAFKEDADAARMELEIKDAALAAVSARVAKVTAAANQRILELQGTVDRSQARERTLERERVAIAIQAREEIQTVADESNSVISWTTQDLLQVRTPTAQFVFDVEMDGFATNRAGGIAIKRTLLENLALNNEKIVLDRIIGEKAAQVSALNLALQQQDLRFGALIDRVTALEDSSHQKDTLIFALTDQTKAQTKQIKHLTRAKKWDRVAKWGGVALAFATGFALSR